MKVCCIKSLVGGLFLVVLVDRYTITSAVERTVTFIASSSYYVAEVDLKTKFVITVEVIMLVANQPPYSFCQDLPPRLTSMQCWVQQYVPQ